MRPIIYQIEDPGSVWAICVEAEYNGDYLADLKKYVLPRDRRWDSDRRAWLFKGIAVDLVIVLLEKYFDSYQWSEPKHIEETQNDFTLA